jgi:hypothetical protein
MNPEEELSSFVVAPEGSLPRGRETTVQFDHNVEVWR